MNPLHASEAKLLLHCPRKWQHAHRRRRVPVREALALTRGRAVHVWLEGWWSGRKPSMFSPGEVLGVSSELEWPEDPIARACCLGYAAYWGGPPPGAWKVEQSWEATIDGIPCAGALDAIHQDSEETVIVEHKTTSQDISPGSVYWRQVVTTDLQVSMYRAAFPGASILYDVIRKPAIRQKNDESDDSFVTRCLEDMSKRPEHYFQRANVVRLEAEDQAFFSDLRAIDAMRRLPMLPRNASACFEYGSRCEYFDVCWGSGDLGGPEFRDQEEVR